MYPHFFDWRKETAVPVKETPFYPCVAPATAVPFKGDKRHHRTHCDSESPPSPLGVGNGFQFTSFARLCLRADISAAVFEKQLLTINKNAGRKIPSGIGFYSKNKHFAVSSSTAG